MTETDAPRPGGEIIVYQAEDGGSRVRVLLEGETVWLTQELIAELFRTTVPNVNIHLKNIYAEGELAEEATIKEYLIVRREGWIMSRDASRPAWAGRRPRLTFDEPASGPVMSAESSHLGSGLFVASDEAREREG